MGRENFQTEWVQRAREQDQEALEALYVFCYSEVYKTIREAINADGDTIKDILQETYIRAFTKLDTLRDDSKFPEWIHSIAHNAAKDFVRKYKPNLFDSLDAVDEDGVPELQLENQDIETMRRSRWISRRPRAWCGKFWIACQPGSDWRLRCTIMNT